MANIDYDKLYHEALVEAGKALKLVGGFRKPQIFDIAAPIYFDKLARLRSTEETMLLADTLAKLIKQLPPPAPTPAPTPVQVDRAREEKAAALKAEKERFEALAREFEETFGNTIFH